MGPQGSSGGSRGWLLVSASPGTAPVAWDGSRKSLCPWEGPGDPPGCFPHIDAAKDVEH